MQKGSSRLLLGRIEPALPVLLGAHGAVTAVLVLTDATLATGLFLLVLCLGVAGLLGWRGERATLLRGLALLVVAVVVQVAEADLVPAVLQWYYVVAAGYGLLLRGWPAALAGPAAAACYLAQVYLGAGVVPPSVALLRAAVLVALGLLMSAAGRAYRAERRSAEQGQAVAEAAHGELAHAARHDPLTGLVNRGTFLAALDEALRWREGAAAGAVLVVGLDRFKTVNDALGRDAGDQLLVDVAGRLGSVATGGGPAARLGSDEFALLVAGGDAAHATDVAHQVRRLMAEPFDVGGRDYTVTASVAVAPLRARATPTGMLRMADAALTHAKLGGRDQVVVYDRGLARGAEQRMDLEQDLRSAVRLGQVWPVYQPICDVVTGRVLGVEVLARWARGAEPVPPGVFIPMAEAMGIIVELGADVLGQATAALARWRAGGTGMGYVAVNVSPVQLRDPGFPALVSGVLADSGLAPSDLVLEITESAIMDDEPAVTAMLGALRELGVEISMDDFGTGYSSLSRLRSLPVSELKVDRSFVAELERDDTVTTMVVALAQRLGLRTIAEGVETQSQLEALRALGCDAAQGYHLGRPMPEEDLLAHLLRARERPLTQGGSGAVRRGVSDGT